MLTLDIDRLSKREITDAVSFHCAELGSVQSVIIMSPPGGHGQMCALVCMADEAQSHAVVERHGDSMVDGMALIKLEAEERDLPRFLLRATPAAAGHAGAAG